MKEIKNALISWGIPAFLSALPFFAWIDCVAERLKNTCALRIIVIATAILLFLATRFLILWINSRKQLKEDFTKNLIPILGSGICVHGPTGEPVCPICSAEGKLEFLWHSHVPGKNGEDGYTQCVCHRCKYKPDIHGNVFKTKTSWKKILLKIAKKYT